MPRFNIIFIFCIIYLGCVESQVPNLAPCPYIDTMQQFDMSRYMGIWYEAERYFAVFEFAGKCVSANYTSMGNGIFRIVNTQTSSITGLSSNIEGQIRVFERSDTSKFFVKFPSLPVPMDAPYWVLDTDYNNYAVVWSCVDLGFFSTRNAWILTRDKFPSLEIINKAYSVFDKNNLDKKLLYKTVQTNCPDPNYEIDNKPFFDFNFNNDQPDHSLTNNKRPVNLNAVKDNNLRRRRIVLRRS